MSYETYRKAFIGSYYDYQLEVLTNKFEPGKKTLIFLPGGMGSQLERTEQPYPNNANVITDVVWIDLGIAPPVRDALKLEIDPQGKDTGSYVVAPHGPISMIGLRPYEKLEEFAQSEGWNYGVFGFDWRRPIEESSNFFKEFIFGFRERIIARFAKDPIPDLTIACHSMGGMVCTDALRDSRFSGLGFNAVVTVATPFYGTSTQQETLFAGMPGILNTFYGPKTVVRIISSLPGPYALFFLPKSIYNRDGRKLGLTRYPEYDPNGNFDVDPYDQSSSVLRRWPKVVRDHRQYLVGAKRSMENIATPINTNIAARFFNVRSSLNPTTAVELLWSNVDGDTIIPGTTPSPLAGVAGPGDGTVPAWSAFHAYCRPSNTHDLTQANDHSSLLEHQEVLTLISSIVRTRKLPTRAKVYTSRLRIASDEKVAAVAAKWAARAKRKQAPPADLYEKPVQRAIAKSLLGGPKPRIVRPSRRSKQRR